MQPFSTSRIVGLILCGALAATGFAADTWPQWGGPQRDFTTSAGPLTWPAGGPRTVWTRALGDGYSTIVADGERLYTLYRNATDREVVIALDPATGNTLWEHDYAAPFVDEGEDKQHVLQFGKGPASTPAVGNGQLITLGFTGVLNAFDAATGKVTWTHDLPAELGANFMRFGHATSPLLYGDKVIVQVGGKQSSGTPNGLVAFARGSGAVAWHTTDKNATYSSPILIRLGGEDLLITYMQDDLLAVDPVTGAERWHIETPGKFESAIMTPIWCPGDRLFCSIEGEEDGGCALTFKKSGSTVTAERAWFNRKIKGTLSNPVRIGNVLYGPAGGRGSIFNAFSLDTGKILWRERGYERCNCVAVGQQLLILDEKGTLTLATPTDQGLTVHGTVALLEEAAWAAPTVVGRRVYLRDNKKILAVEFGG